MGAAMNAAASPDSGRTARADAQRDRILCAAEACFAERGLHAASMSLIAETAGMSPGLIYRYFDGKTAIIHGIVGRQLELLARDVLQHDSRQPDLVEMLVASYGQRPAQPAHGSQARVGLAPALLLEITAEAIRDPEIAGILGQFDALIRQAIRSWLQRPCSEGGRGLSEDQARHRELVLRSVIDGLKMRQARDPDLDLDLLRAALQDALPRLLAADDTTPTQTPPVPR